MRTLTVCMILVMLAGCAQPRVRHRAKHPRVKTAGFAVQAGAFSQVKNAEALAERLQHKGIDAFYFRKPDGIFVVRFGDFSSQDEARQYAARLVKDGAIDAYYVAPPVDLSAYSVRQPGQKKTDRRRDEDLGSVIARTAERFVGIPYKWGGNTVVDGMDCSGFSKAVYNLCGITIPRTSQEQFNGGDSVASHDIDDGDLVFFGDSKTRITHVGIYVGGGKMVHAPKRGDDIKIARIDSGYFSQRFVGARRYF